MMNITEVQYELTTNRKRHVIEFQFYIKPFMLSCEPVEQSKCERLSCNLKMLYKRYRVGDYRLLCEISDNELFVLVVDV